MTKAKQKLHVVLCSSDSFMYNWLSNLVENDRGEILGFMKDEQL